MSWEEDYAKEIAAAKAAKIAGGLAEDDVWTTDELQKVFTFEYFAAPLAIVTRKSDGAKGAVLFDHSPRIYFGFKPSRR